MNKVIKHLVLASGLIIAGVGSASAALERVGPNDTQNGFPLWYQDSQGLALDLCVPKSDLQLDACLAVQPPSYPFAFPNNWSDEFFWFGADASLDLGGASTAVLVQAVEAAFGGLGTPNPGGQISFARIRIRFDAPVAGDYTVTYPYGVKQFPGVAAGEAIFYTDDVGIGAPGDFTGAMTGEVGPFLRAVDGTGALSPFVQIDGDTFLSDPLGTTAVSGSPIGANRFEISVVQTGGVVTSWTTDQFALIGKVHTAAIGSPMQVTSAIFSRDTIGGDVFVDVHATAVSGPGSAEPVLTLGMVGQPSVLMQNELGTISGKYYGQSIIGAPATKPNDVTVINSGDTPASSVKVPLVDMVTITNATFDVASGSLNIQANSSDAEVTQLFVGIVDSTGVSVSAPFTASGAATIATGYVFPPETLTVTSPSGGSATTSLTIACNGCRGATFTTGAPLAVDDTAVCATAAACTITVLANDGAEAAPGTVVLVDLPANGTASTDGSTVTYTPDAGGVVDSLMYTVNNGSGLSSNVATVSINLGGATPAPPVVEAPPAEQLSVARSECRTGKNEWRVDGASTVLTPHSVTVYAGSTVAGGTVIASNVLVDNLGAWSARATGACVSTVSIESSGGAVLEGVAVTIR